MRAKRVSILVAPTMKTIRTSYMDFKNRRFEIIDREKSGNPADFGLGRCCVECKRIFKSKRGLLIHRGRKHKWIV